MLVQWTTLSVVTQDIPVDIDCIIDTSIALIIGISGDVVANVYSTSVGCTATWSYGPGYHTGPGRFRFLVVVDTDSTDIFVVPCDSLPTIIFGLEGSGSPSPLRLSDLNLGLVSVGT